MGGDAVRCGSLVYFGYTRAFWSTSSTFRRADIRQSWILRHRRSERSSAGSPQPSSCVACGRAHIRTSSDLIEAMVALVRIDGAHVEVAPNRGARLDILVTRLKCCLAGFSLLIIGLLPPGAVAQITESLPANAVPLSVPQAPAAAPGEQPTYAGGTVITVPRPFLGAELDEAYNSNIFALTTRPISDLITGLYPR